MADFDEARFVEDVLKPVQEGWSPTDNLFRAYLLPVGCSDPALIQAALDQVSRQIAGQRLQRGFPSAVGRLRAGHPRAIEVLTTRRQREEHAIEVRRLGELLKETLRDRLAGGPGLPPKLVSAAVQDSRGAHTRNEVREALAELNAAEQDPVDVPSPPAPKTWNKIRSLLGELGVRSVYEYLTTTPELSGAKTEEKHLDQRNTALRIRRDAAKTSEANLIETLRLLVRAHALVDVLRFELLDGLGTTARYRYPELQDAAEAEAARIRALGIAVPPRALAYAVWCRQRYPEAVSADSGWRQRKRDAVAAKELRTAVEALKSADKLTAVEQKELADLTVRVQEADGELARAAGLERADPDGAARIYLAIRAQFMDPAIEAGLARCRPGPASNVTARLDGGKVAVAWQPSPSTAGRIGYTVVRAQDHRSIGMADGTEVLSDGVALSVVDDAPPAGHELFYTVYAVREGVSMSEPASSSALLALAEAQEFDLLPAADAIRGRWDAPAAASGAVVTRRIAGEMGTWTNISDVRRNQFTDLTAESGVQYEYRLQLTYALPGGRTATSAGQVASGRCQEVPVAVSTLDARLDGDDVVVSWPTPPLGEVEIRQITGAAPRSGVVPTTSLDQIGAPVSGVILRRRSELRARPRAGTGSLVLLAVTVLGDLTAIGPTRTLDRRTKPVTDLKALLRGHEAELTWVWPDAAIEARVLHRAGMPPSGPEDPAATWHLITRAAYEAVGAQFALLPGRNFFAVCTTTSDGDRRTFSALATVEMESIVEVTYRVSKARLLSNRRVLTVGTAGGPVLPQLQLVARSRTRPIARNQGVPLLDLDGGAAQLSGEFTIPRELSRPVHLRLFALEPGIVLRAEQPVQLIID